MNKSQYYAKVSKTLKKYNLSWKEYKNEPHKLFVLDISFAKYWAHKFKYDQDITWFNNPYNLSLMLTDEQVVNIIEEFRHIDPEFTRYLIDWFKDTCRY